MTSFHFPGLDYPNLFKYSLHEDFLQHVKIPQWLFLLFKSMYINYDELSQNEKMYLGYQYISVFNDDLEKNMDTVKNILNVNIILLTSNGSIIMNHDQNYPYIIIYYDEIYYLIGVEKCLLFYYQHPVIDILNFLAFEDKKHLN